MATFLIGCSGALAPDPSAGSGSQAVNGGTAKEGATSGTLGNTPPTTNDPGTSGGKEPPPTTNDPGDKGGKGGPSGAPSSDPACFSVTFPGCTSVADAKMASIAKCAGLELAAFTIGPVCGEQGALEISFTCCAPATTEPPTKPGDPPKDGCGGVPAPTDPGAPPPPKTTGTAPTSSDPSGGTSKK